MPSVMSHGVLQTMGDFYSKCYDAHIDGYQNAYKKGKVETSTVQLTIGRAKREKNFDSCLE